MTPGPIVFELLVADMAASLAFYRRLGLDIAAEHDTAPHVEVDLAPGVRLLFDLEATARAIDPSWSPPTGGHRAALGFGQADAAAVDATYAELVEAGHRSEHAPWDAFWGQRYAVVLDPDGLPVDLYAPLAAPRLR